MSGGSEKCTKNKVRTDVRLKNFLKELIVEQKGMKLNSLSPEKFAWMCARAWYNRWLIAKERNGDRYPEVNDIDYLTGYMLGESMDAYYVRKGHLGFIYDCIEDGRFTAELASGQKDFYAPGSGKRHRSSEVEFQGEKCASFQGGCYYNALDFMLRTDRDDASLAYGIMINNKFVDDLKRASSKTPPNRIIDLQNELTEHSFVLIDGDKVFDPSLPHSELKGEAAYTYKTVPESVYSNFSHEFDDKNYTAREFGDYIEKELRKYYGKLNLKQKVRKLHERREKNE